MDDLESSPILHHSYFPFTRLPGRFASIDANSSFPLCRVGYGGQVREGNNAADARAAVLGNRRLSNRKEPDKTVSGGRKIGYSHFRTYFLFIAV